MLLSPRGGSTRTSSQCTGDDAPCSPRYLLLLTFFVLSEDLHAAGGRKWGTLEFRQNKTRSCILGLLLTVRDPRGTANIFFGNLHGLISD